MSTIVVASKNPVKIQAVREGASRLFPEEQFTFEGVSVPSGVPDQPMGNEQTLLGARTRAENAKAAIPSAEYWVGLEGGIEELEDGSMQAYAWIVVIDKQHSAQSRTASFLLPAPVCELVRAGHELGEAIDRQFSQENSKHKEGASGLLTDGLVSRLILYEMAVIFAFTPFKQKALYHGDTVVHPGVNR